MCRPGRGLQVGGLPAPSPPRTPATTGLSTAPQVPLFQNVTELDSRSRCSLPTGCLTRGRASEILQSEVTEVGLPSRLRCGDRLWVPAAGACCGCTRVYVAAVALRARRGPQHHGACNPRRPWHLRDVETQLSLAWFREQAEGAEPSPESLSLRALE